jgi:hypothetical protein
MGWVTTRSDGNRETLFCLAFRMIPQVSVHHPIAHNPKVGGSNPPPATESPSQRIADRGFYRPEDACTVASTGFSADCRRSAFRRSGRLPLASRGARADCATGKPSAPTRLVGKAIRELDTM